LNHLAVLSKKSGNNPLPDILKKLVVVDNGTALKKLVSSPIEL
jgi:hypothetical protein